QLVRPEFSDRLLETEDFLGRGQPLTIRGAVGLDTLTHPSLARLAAVVRRLPPFLEPARPTVELHLHPTARTFEDRPVGGRLEAGDHVAASGGLAVQRLPREKPAPGGRRDRRGWLDPGHRRRHKRLVRGRRLRGSLVHPGPSQTWRQLSLRQSNRWLEP